MDLSRLIKGAALIVLAASTWMSVESSSVSAQTSGEDAIKMFDDCVKACVDRMELAKTECVAHQTAARNYDTKCVLNKEKEVVDCVRACKQSSQ